MCILVVKPEGIGFPEVDTMYNCFLSNPDGAGIAYNDNGQVKIYKGIMQWEKFEKIYKKISAYKEKTFIFHFRIGTHGLKRSAKHTHPFPIVQDYDVMEKRSSVCNKVMAHNGIIGTIDLHSGKSDTMEFNYSVLSPLLNSGNSLKDIELTLNAMLGDTNKLAVLSSNGTFETYGKFYIENGVYYSNQSYMPYTYVSSPKQRCELFKDCKNHSKKCKHCNEFEEFEDIYYIDCPNVGYCKNYPKKCSYCDGWSEYMDNYDIE